MSCTAVRKASSESLICECTPSSCALDRHQIEGFFKGILAGFASRSAGDKLLGFFQSFPDVGQPLAGDIVRLQSHHDAANGRCYRFACARQFDIALAISLQFPLQVPKRGCDLRFPGLQIQFHLSGLTLDGLSEPVHDLDSRSDYLELLAECAADLGMHDCHLLRKRRKRLPDTLWQPCGFNPEHRLRVRQRGDEVLEHGLGTLEPGQDFARAAQLGKPRADVIAPAVQVLQRRRQKTRSAADDLIALRLSDGQTH
jgi:hypothetical protein